MSSHHLSGMVSGVAFLCSRNEKTEGGHGNEERQRQIFVLAGSREGSGTCRHLQGRVSPREVLLLGSANRYCAHPFSRKGLLNKTWGANVLFVQVFLPCTRISSSVWAPTVPWMAPDQASKQRGLVVVLRDLKVCVS